MKGRCTGACCRVFNLPHAPEVLKERAAVIRDGEQIASMVIHLGFGRPEDFGGSPSFEHEQPPSHFYTCRNHDAESGDCLVYETRPTMCRDFPYGSPCPYKECEAPTFDVPVSNLARMR